MHDLSMTRSVLAFLYTASACHPVNKKKESIIKLKLKHKTSTSTCIGLRLLAGKHLGTTKQEILGNFFA